MIEQLAKNLVSLKKEFSSKYDGKSQMHEVIPTSTSESFNIEQQDLELLHKFATKNPIYYNSYEQIIGNIKCIVYEGDINKYWLNSIQHSSTHAPFSPTWIMSAYVATLITKELGYSEVIDIGSGDGRIAFCSKILNMEAYSIEIDNQLFDLQKLLVTTLDFHPFCSNAITFNYDSLNLNNPAFFIGGLAQMGGVTLAKGVIEKIKYLDYWKKSGWIFAGTYSQKYASDPKNEAGWGTLIENYQLQKLKTISLPTAWTFHETEETPYVFAEAS
jgi:hypothetical protein